MTKRHVRSLRSTALQLSRRRSHRARAVPRIPERKPAPQPRQLRCRNCQFSLEMLQMSPQPRGSRTNSFRRACGRWAGCAADGWRPWRAPTAMRRRLSPGQPSSKRCAAPTGWYRGSSIAMPQRCASAAVAPGALVARDLRAHCRQHTALPPRTRGVASLARSRRSLLEAREGGGAWSGGKGGLRGGAPGRGGVLKQKRLRRRS